MNTMRKMVAVAAGSLLVVTSMNASAALFSFSNEFSGSGDTCANVTCATLNVTQNNGGVDFALTANLAPGEFITGLYGNRDPFAVSTASNVNGTTNENSSILSNGLNAFQADGDGKFDWVWDFSSTPPRLDGLETFTWTFANTELDDIINAISVDGPAGKNGFTFALRVQGLDDKGLPGLDNEGSGWFNSNGDGGGGDDEVVPEPGTLALVGLALIGAAASRRRRR